MNRTSVRFSCTALAGTSKAGRLPKDADGYYTMPVGGLNVFNSMGEYYTYEGAKELFTGSAPLMRRVRSGCLKGEYGHPRREPGQSMDDFAARVMRIDEKTTCAHFAEIWLDFDNVKDANGRPIIAIMAKVAPSGPMGPALASSLENRMEEVCFSIRAFTADDYVRGVKQRCLKEIVTWDFVHEPGLPMARKFRSPALESFHLESYHESTFERSNIESTLKHASGVAMESTQAAGLNLIRAIGWDIDPKQVPKFLNW